MTRQDYKIIADAIKSIGHDKIATSDLYTVIYALIDHFQKDNPRFDKKIFMSACGL
jgi:hypothetical protein